MYSDLRIISPVLERNFSFLNLVRENFSVNANIKPRLHHILNEFSHRLVYAIINVILEEGAPVQEKNQGRAATLGGREVAGVGRRSGGTVAEPCPPCWSRGEKKE